MKKNKLNVRKEHRPFVDLWVTSRIMFEQGKREPVRSNYFFFGSIMFAAFSFESFLNHIGAEVFEFWPSLGRPPVKGKINIVCDKLGIKPDYKHNPWNKICELFAFRNDNVHAKTTKEFEECVVASDDEFDEVLRKGLVLEWTKYSNEKNAESVRTEIERAMKVIWKATGKEDVLLFSGSYADATGTPCDD